MKNVLNHDLLHQKYFEEMTRIPHGSFHEEAYSNYLVEFAKAHMLAYKQDEAKNVIIYKDASVGYEDHELVILQAHIDMVCEKHRDVVFDFEKDPLQLKIEDGFLMANGTTLGADDGSGVAYMLAILADETLSHPALECIFTVQEEVGLFGALALKKEQIHGKKMINLDDGGGNVSCISAAGGMCVTLSKDLITYPCEKMGYEISIKGLKGGHSGGEIHKERGNANRFLARILYALNEKYGIQIQDFAGGDKDNAIPREANASFVCDQDSTKIQAMIHELKNALFLEYEFSDPDFSININEVNITHLMSIEDSEQFIQLLYVLPDGLAHSSMNIEDLPNASSNLAVVSCNQQIEITVSVRGSLESFVDDLANQCKILAYGFHYDYEGSARYPAWGYEEKNSLREVMKKVCVDVLKKPLQLIAVHGGLECGVFKALQPDMEIVTMGPLMYDIHTPNERMSMESFDQTYEFLCAFLKAL